MIDPTLMQLNQIQFRERLEAAAQARRQGHKPAGRSLIDQLRSAIAVGMSLPAVAAPRKVNP